MGEKNVWRRKRAFRETEKNSRYYQLGWGSTGTGPGLEFKVLLRAFKTSRMKESCFCPNLRGKLVGKEMEKSETRCRKGRPVFKKCVLSLQSHLSYWPPEVNHRKENVWKNDNRRNRGDEGDL